MRIKKATKQYETWLAEYTNLVEADLATKHTQMAVGPFPFLRATFYRWAQVWPEVCPTLTTAPAVLAVGDLHVENFGTWRDAEGRLIWGVNDFDEAYTMPYTNDLIRLAVSVLLAIDANHLKIAPRDACVAILEGYTESLQAGGRAFVLSEDHDWLREIAISKLRDPTIYWKKMEALPTAKEPIPLSAREALEHRLPAVGLKYRVVHRVAGLGSLGHPRLVALADWCGGEIAREAKALVPSGYLWAYHNEGPIEILYQAILSRAVRCQDPFVQLRGQWIVRRLAPDCSRIELAALPETRNELRLLHAMGWETANIHAGSTGVLADVRRDLKKRGSGWLRSGAEAMAQAVTADWKEWKAETPPLKTDAPGEVSTREPQATEPALPAGT